MIPFLTVPTWFFFFYPRLVWLIFVAFPVCPIMTLLSYACPLPPLFLKHQRSRAQDSSILVLLGYAASRLQLYVRGYPRFPRHRPPPP